MNAWTIGSQGMKIEGSVSFNGQFSPNLHLKNMISTYTKEIFMGKKMIQIRLEISKRKKIQIVRFYETFQ
jgi:hypothetical protein